MKKPIKENNKTLLQQSAFVNDTDVTDNVDTIHKKTQQNVDLFPHIYC